MMTCFYSVFKFYSVSTTGMLAGIKMSHAAVTSLCRSMKLACELYPSRHIALCLDPYCGLGFALWCLSRCVLIINLVKCIQYILMSSFLINFSVYSGHHSILIPPSEIEINPGLWLTAVSQYQVRDTFCSYGNLYFIYQNRLIGCITIYKNINIIINYIFYFI